MSSGVPSSTSENASGEAPIRFFLLHVPKCAGSTINAHLRNHLGPRALEAPRSSSKLRNFGRNRYPFEVYDPAIRHVRLFYGHALSRSLTELLPGAEIREAVMLRDPAGYFISMYNFMCRRHVEGSGPKRPPFEEWYAAERKDPIARFLMQRYFEYGAPRLYRFSSAGKLNWLEERLSKFWFVGSYRHVELLTDRIAETLELPGSPQRENSDTLKVVTKEKLGPEVLARIERDNAVDAALHARWRNRCFDPERNPDPPSIDLPVADQVSLLVDEATIGLRKTWLKRVKGYYR